MGNENKARTTIDLGGTWKYKLDPNDEGVEQKWYVPDLDRSAWGEMDIPTNWYLTEVGDYFGVAWFATAFSVPQEMEGQHLTLRFRAVDYEADVWLNGEYLGSHLGYFAPFEFDVTDLVKPGRANVVGVRVANKKLNEVGTGGIVAPVFFWSPSEEGHKPTWDGEDVTPVEFK